MYLLKRSVFILFIFLISSCGYNFKTIITSPEGYASYESPLIVVPYHERAPLSKKFAEYLKNDLENQLALQNKKADVVIVPTRDGKIQPYPDNPSNVEINSIIQSNNNDLLITFNRKGNMVNTFKYHYSERYEIVATDQKTEKECWMGQLKTMNSYGIKKAAPKVILGLIESGLL